MCRQHCAGGWATGPGHQPCAWVDDVVFAQTCVRNGLLHRDMRIGGAGAHKSQGAFVDMVSRVDLEGARDLAAETVFGHFRRCLDPGPARFERGGNLFGIGPDRGHDAESCDDNTAHGVFLPD